MAGRQCLPRGSDFLINHATTVNVIAAMPMRPPIIIDGPNAGTAIFMNRKEEPQIAPSAISQASCAGRKRYNRSEYRNYMILNNYFSGLK